MSAFTCLVNSILEQGDHIIIGKRIYGGIRDMCTNYLPKIGIDVDMIDGSQLDKIKAALNSKTKLVWYEPCTNPTCMLNDVETIAKMAHDFNKEIIVGCDNTFLTPYALVRILPKMSISIVSNCIKKW